MMACPGAHGDLIHDYPFHNKGPERIVTGSIFEPFSYFFNMRIGQIVYPIPFEEKWSFHQSFGWQISENNRVRCEFSHVVIEFSSENSAHGIINIGLTVFIDKSAWIDSMDIFYRFRLGDKWPDRIVCNRNANSKSPALISFDICRKIEIEFPVPFNTIGSPHAVRCTIHPIDLILAYNHT